MEKSHDQIRKTVVVGVGSGCRVFDESIAVENGDVVMVPEGYHPVGAAHGYDLYHLNVMAGPKQVWQFKNDPAHEWMLQL